MPTSATMQQSMQHFFKEIAMRKSLILFYAAVLFACFLMTGCASNAPKYGAKCNDVYEKTFWANLSGGGVDGGAQAWANLKAHNAGEACMKGAAS